VREHLGIHVARDPRRAPGRDGRRHRLRDPEACRGARLQRGARVLRPRHRAQVPRGAADPALRQARAGRAAQAGHGVHGRADDQRGKARYPTARRRLDHRHARPQPLGAVGAHGGGDRRGVRGPDPLGRRPAAFVARAAHAVTA
jgi:hypothetical protein